MDVMFEPLTKILVAMHSLSLSLSFSLCVFISAALSVLSLMPVCISRAETTLESCSMLLQTQQPIHQLKNNNKPLKTSN